MHHLAIAAARAGSFRLFQLKKKNKNPITLFKCVLQQADGVRQGWIREQSALFSLSAESREEEVDRGVAKLRDSQRNDTTRPSRQSAGIQDSSQGSFLFLFFQF